MDDMPLKYGTNRVIWAYGDYDHHRNGNCSTQAIHRGAKSLHLLSSSKPEVKLEDDVTTWDLTLNKVWLVPFPTFRILPVTSYNGPE